MLSICSQAGVFIHDYSCHGHALSIPAKWVTFIILLFQMPTNWALLTYNRSHLLASVLTPPVFPHPNHTLLFMDL